ncbi:MAG: RNA polymerase sigma factor [Candidatus Limnocylindrales bacterium]
MDQGRLVVQAREGDHDAFAVLLGACVARLDAVARLILRDPELARDAVQEAAIRAWRDLPGLREPDRFDAWIHRVVVRACFDAARKRRRRVTEVELLALDGPSTPDVSVDIADRDLLDRALRRLEPEARATIVLRYYVGMSVPDVAACMGIPLGTAKARLSRALVALRTTIEASPVAGDGTPVTAAPLPRRYA